jgi:protein-tyrosine phosphatase
VIDLHCHLLPAVDDGPGSRDAALELIRVAAEAGTRTMVATPHVSADYPRNTRDSIAEAVEALRPSLDATGIDIDIRVGAEVSLLHCELLRRDEGERLLLGDGPYRLVELPFLATPQTVDMLLGMHHWVHPVLLAHPERCTAFQTDPELLGRLVDRGMLVQITASSFSGRFGSTVQRTAWEMLGQGLVHVVASDCHDLRGRTPLLREPLEEAGLDELIPVLCERNPAAILAGERPEPAAPVTPPRAMRFKQLRSRLSGKGARRAGR